jgi:hypothetical protein
MVQDDNSIFLSGECGVQKFPRKQPARIGQDQEHSAEFATLGFVYSQRKPIRAALMNWEYEPATINGHPSLGFVQVNVE